MSAGDERRGELAGRLDAVHRRIERACSGAGRDAGEVTLIVVTKTYPAADVRLLHELGVRDVAENRDQEAAPKAADTADLDLRRHFVGQLQSNKARSVAGYSDVVQSVDRLSLVQALSNAARPTGRTLDCLVQVTLEDDPDRSTGGARGGAAPDEVGALAEAIAGADALELRGVMAVAPLGADPRAAFARLAAVARSVRADHPHASWISAGMSGDLEAAVQLGATHVRVGTAILGSRPTPH